MSYAADLRPCEWQRVEAGTGSRSTSAPLPQHSCLGCKLLASSISLSMHILVVVIPPHTWSFSSVFSPFTVTVIIRMTVYICCCFWQLYSLATPFFLLVIEPNAVADLLCLSACFLLPLAPNDRVILCWAWLTHCLCVSVCVCTLGPLTRPGFPRIHLLFFKTEG